ncbi:alpha/beta hydrolase [Planctellipticum variicoloris]|uniref:alpha/beta hydrolase n=1 Tax=Planctellipticum variicoloris TaxID=3064265 RepID=UPI003013F536|nr:alpha/beta hydrolase-fold protein [Planctomycetaceae bacterium SH412]
MNPQEITTERLNGSRRIWLQPSADAACCWIFLDAELYLDRVGAVQIVEQLLKDGGLPPVTFAYISSLDAAARHRDYTCSDDYATFLIREVIPWIEQSQGRFERYYLGGLSLSGLAAAYALCRHPGVFSGGLCQSPSAWWNDEWLTAAIASQPARPGRLWVSVGNQELQQGVSHPPTGLFQQTSQLDSVRRLVRQLETSFSQVRSHEYDGGHDPACWAAELPDALTWVLAGHE